MTRAHTPAPPPGRRPSLLRRGARVLAATLLLAGVSGGAVAVDPLPDHVLAIDHSRGAPGFCPDGDGVTVVIDFQELGGDTLVRCAPGDQETGHAALVNAGIEITGTNRWGEAFICRIEGKPGPETEPCIDTPPASAYWSYWHAPNDGAWTYSQWGVMNRKPPPGSFEGWSFSLNRSADTNPPPRVDPVRPAVDGGGSGGGDGGSGGGDGSGDRGGSGGGSGDGAGGGRTDSGGGGGAPDGGSGDGGPGEGDADSTGGGSADDGGSEATGYAHDTDAPGDEPSRFDEPVPGPDDMPVEAADWTGGEENPDLVSSASDVGEPPWGTVLGGGAALLLAVVALATAWQRRQARGSHAG